MGPLRSLRTPHPLVAARACACGPSTTARWQPPRVRSRARAGHLLRATRVPPLGRSRRESTSGRRWHPRPPRADQPARSCVPASRISRSRSSDGVSAHPFRAFRTASRRALATSRSTQVAIASERGASSSTERPAAAARLHDHRIVEFSNRDLRHRSRLLRWRLQCNRGCPRGLAARTSSAREAAVASAGPDRCFRNSGQFRIGPLQGNRAPGPEVAGQKVETPPGRWRRAEDATSG